MSETRGHRKGKATELLDDLMSHPLSPEEVARRQPHIPELRLRDDTPAVEIAETTRVQDVLGRLEDTDSLALRNSAAEPLAVVISVERYLELVGKELARDPWHKVGTLDGRVVPRDEDLAAGHVEQVDPTAPWQPRGRLT
jgi:hypothetical protein